MIYRCISGCIRFRNQGSDGESNGNSKLKMKWKLGFLDHLGV